MKFSLKTNFPKVEGHKNRRLHVNPRIDNAFRRSRGTDRDDRMGTVLGRQGDRLIRLASGRRLSSSQSRPTPIPAEELKHVNALGIVHIRSGPFARCDAHDVRIRIVEAVEDAPDGDADGLIEQRARVEA